MTTLVNEPITKVSEIESRISHASRRLGFHIANTAANFSLPVSVEGMDECEDWPTISWQSATVMLGVITLLISAQSECLVSSIEGVSRNQHIPESFIGVILLPIVGNAAEHATAVTVAIKNKPDLTMGVAVGSSTQV